MANLLSPGVAVTTKDLSQVTTAAGDSAACFSGDFVKGPVNTPVLISSVQELKETFGNPTKYNYNQWYQVYNFLQYSGEIYVVRAADLNGTPSETQLNYNSSEFVSSHIEHSIKDFDILNANAETLEFRDSNDIDLSKGKTLRFNTDPKLYKIVASEKVVVPVENPLYVPLTDLSVDFNGVAEVEEGQTISYDYETEDGASVGITGEGAEIDTIAKTIRFTKNGLVSIEFVAEKTGERPKTLVAQFNVSKIQTPTQPTIDMPQVESGAETIISVEHEDGTTLKAQIKNDDGLKGKVNVI